MIKLITDKPKTSYLLGSECCEYMVSHSGTGLTARPKSNCRKRAVVDFHGKRVCQQHAGALALEQLLKEQNA